MAIVVSLCVATLAIIGIVVAINVQTDVPIGKIGATLGSLGNKTVDTVEATLADLAPKASLRPSDDAELIITQPVG